MSDPAASLPRVDVHLPGGHVTPGRLLVWRQGADGRWWAEITIPVPADAVRQVDGEDYSTVPREPAEPPEPAFLLAAPIHQGPRRLLTVHAADCWTLRRDSARYRVQEIGADDARTMLARFDDTEACTTCHPDP